MIDIPNKDDSNTDDPNLAKRRVRLDNAKAQHEGVGMVLSKLGDDAPPATLKNWMDVGDALRAAKVGIKGPDGERLVHVATSLAAVLTQSAAIIGIKVVSGGKKGRDSGGRSVDDDRLSICLRWRRDNPSNCRGWKSDLANHLVETCGINPAAAQKYIYRNLPKIK